MKKLFFFIFLLLFPCITFSAELRKPDNSLNVPKEYFVPELTNIKVDKLPNEKIEKETPNTLVFEENGELVYFIYGNPIQHKIDNTWYKIDYVPEKITKRTYWRKITEIFSIIGVNAVDYYASAGDGEVEYTDGTWSTAHDAGTGEAVDYTSSKNYITTYLAAGTYYIRRGFFAFDTSAIDDGATIGTASLKVKPYSVESQDASSANLHLVEGTQANETTLATADYDALGTTDYATALPYSGMSGGTYSTWTLNSTGKSAISKTGYTKLALRWADDKANTAPGSGKGWHFYAYNSEETGTGNDPYLVVTIAETCTSWTYTDWTPDPCPVEEEQTREILTSSPEGCTGGSPILTQECVYTPEEENATTTADIDSISSFMDVLLIIAFGLIGTYIFYIFAKMIFSIFSG